MLNTFLLRPRKPLANLNIRSLLKPMVLPAFLLLGLRGLPRRPRSETATERLPAPLPRGLAGREACAGPLRRWRAAVASRQQWLRQGAAASGRFVDSGAGVSVRCKPEAQVSWAD